MLHVAGAGDRGFTIGLAKTTRRLRMISLHPLAHSEHDGRLLRAGAVPSPLTLSVLHPPYDSFVPLPTYGVLPPTALAPASVLVLGVPQERAERCDLEAVVPGLRRILPSSPIVMSLQGQSQQAGMSLAFRAARLGVRAMISADTTVPDALRRALTRPVDLPRDVVEWLEIRGVELTPIVADLVRQIFLHAPHESRVSGTLRIIGEPATTARLHFRRSRAPSPGQWHRMARALWTAMRIQAEVHEPLLTLAYRLGYGDHSALSQQIHRAFRLRPQEIRGTLGWEWLLDRWVHASFSAALAPHPRERRSAS
jgi:hypothetical protein